MAVRMIVTKFERGATPGVLVREFDRMAKVAYREAMEVDKNEILPQLFTKRGAAKRGVRRRQASNLPRSSRRFRSSHTGRKLSAFGHVDPLVFTGQLRSEVLGSAKVTSTSKKGTLWFRGGKVLFRPPIPGVETYGDELVRRTESDLRKVAGAFDRAMQRQITNHKHRKRTRLKAA